MSRGNHLGKAWDAMNKYYNRFLAYLIIPTLAAVPPTLLIARAIAEVAG